MTAPNRRNGRFGKVRRQYIWHIVKQGPTEIGYAYFRARRRRRNVPDDESLLSESDQLVMSGAFDATDEDARGERCADRALSAIGAVRDQIDPVVPAVLSSRLLRWNAHAAALRRPLRAGARGRESHFHCYDVGEDRVGGMARKITEAFPALRSATFTSGQTPVRRTCLPSTRRSQRCGRVPTRWYACRSARAQVLLRAGQRAAVLCRRGGCGDGRGDVPVRLARASSTPGPRRGVPLVRQSGGFVRAGRRPAPLSPCGEPSDPRAPVRVFFYGRPSTPRNAFGLGIAALAQAEARSRRPRRDHLRRRGLEPGAVRPAPTGSETSACCGHSTRSAALYRSCDIGLVFMRTKHPSYQPFEFMASGVATVSNINPATTWLLRDGENCLLSPPLPTPTAERLGRLVDDAGAARAGSRRRACTRSATTAGRSRSSGSGRRCAARDASFAPDSGR